MKNIFIILFLLLSSVATAQNVTRMATASGTDTYAATFNPPLTSLSSATLYVITFTNANTSTTVTLNPDGVVAATAIKDNAGSDPVVGALVAGGTYTLRYNGTNFRIVGSTGSTDTNIGNTNQTLTGDRTVTGAGNNLTLSVNNLDLDPVDNLLIGGAPGTTNQVFSNVDGHPNWLDASSLIVNNLYTANGVFSGDRIANANGFDFQFLSADSIEFGGTGQFKAVFQNMHLQTSGTMRLHSLGDINFDASGDGKINNVSGNSGEFIGNVDGHLVWAVPPGGSGGSSSSAVLDVNTTTVGNVGAGEDVLWTYTLPGDSLSVDEQGLWIRIAGLCAANGNSKGIKLRMGDDFMVNPGAGNLNATWSLDCQVIRTSATTLKSNCQVVSIISGNSHTVLGAITETLSGDVVIQLTGEAVADNDIIKESATVIRMEGGGTGSGGVGGGDLSVSDLVTSETPTGAVNGTNVTYTLANTPAAFTHVYLDGLLQVEGGGNDYTISGTTITMVAAPLTGSRIRVSYIK